MVRMPTYPIIDRDQVNAALAASKGRVASAAAALGVSRQAVYEAISRYGLRRRKETRAEKSERMRRTRLAALQPRESAA